MSESKDNTQSIPLKGSAHLITEFFYYGLNHILFQRGIYPPENFKRHTKYGMTTLVTTDEDVEKYLTSVLNQMKEWLQSSCLRRVVVVVASIATGRVLERWAFDVALEDKALQETIEAGITPMVEPPPGSKEQTKIVAEIRALLTQITATVAVLPLLDEASSFEVLIYTTEDTPTPVKWNESSPRVIPNAHSVQLRSFSTSVHNIDTAVSFAPPRDPSAV